MKKRILFPHFALILMLLPGITCSQTHAQESQVVVAASDEQGLLFGVKINVAGGVLEFAKVVDGKKQQFNTIKEVIDFMASYGYKLLIFGQLAARSEYDEFTHTQYIFEKKNEGSYPPLPLA